jgi:hypothetical protein
VFALHPRVVPMLLPLCDVGYRAYAYLSGYNDDIREDAEVMVIAQGLQELFKMAFRAQKQTEQIWKKGLHYALIFRRLLAQVGLSIAITSVSSTEAESEAPHGLGDVERLPPQSLIERFVDNDRLDDRTWRAEMREVEIWENERFQPLSDPRGNFFQLLIFQCTILTRIT